MNQTISMQPMSTQEYLKELEIEEKKRDDQKMESDYNRGKQKADNGISAIVKKHEKKIQHFNILLETRLLRYKSLESEIKVLLSEIKKNNEAIEKCKNMCVLDNNKVDLNTYTDNE